MESLNLNDYVWVKLTDKGRAMLTELDARWSTLFASSFGRLAVAQKQEADFDGWSQWQLWVLIETFGQAIHMGSEPPFETTIRLTAPEIGSGTK